MARASPGVLRMASILNFIADHPGQSFTLTDLVKALKLSRATCHALLTGLVEVGYLYRASDKVYVLGPTLAAIGRTAAEHASPLQVAQPEMRAMADEFDCVCACFFRERDEIFVRDRAAAASQVGWSVPLGTRLKLRPPFGGIFYAWSAEADARAWMDEYEPAPTQAHREEMMSGMLFARQYGFQVTVRKSGTAGHDRPAEKIFGDDSMDFPISLLPDINDDTSYPAVGIMSPVFLAGGKVAFVMGITGFTRPMSGADIKRFGGRLREACDRVTRFLVGRPPRSYLSS
jgi:DNA-binding IclR family transcriptional regulator